MHMSNTMLLPTFATKRGTQCNVRECQERGLGSAYHQLEAILNNIISYTSCAYRLAGMYMLKLSINIHLCT